MDEARGDYEHYKFETPPYFSRWVSSHVQKNHFQILV